MWLSVWSEVQTCTWPSCCHCHSLSLASVKSRLILPFWYRLTRIVPDKGPLNGCVCVCDSFNTSTLLTFDAQVLPLSDWDCIAVFDKRLGNDFAKSHRYGVHLIPGQSNHSNHNSPVRSASYAGRQRGTAHNCCHFAHMCLQTFI